MLLPAGVLPFLFDKPTSRLILHLLLQ